MLRVMQRLHLTFLTLVLWRYTNGFSVQNKISVIDWQAGGYPNVWNQDVHLATPAEPFAVPSREAINGSIGGENPSSVLLTSEVPTAQHDTSFGQLSGDAVSYGKPILNAQSQATSVLQRQDNFTSPLSRLPWYKPGACGTLRFLSQTGFQRSSSQSAASPSQSSGAHSQPSYQPSSPTLVLAGQSTSTSQGQPLNAQRLYEGLTSRRYPSSLGHGIPTSSHSVVATNPISGSQAQSSQPSSTQVFARQSDSIPQAQGSYGAETSGPVQWYTTSGQNMPSPLQVSRLQPQLSYQPGSTTPVLVGQSTSITRASGASALYPSSISGRNPVLQGQSPSSSQVSGFHTQSLYRPSSTTRVLAGQSASTAQGSYGAVSSGPAQWYTASSGQNMPSPLQASGLQPQLSYQPGSTTPVLVGQSTSITQTSGASALYPSLVSGRNLVLQGQSPSSSQVSGFHTQSLYRPSSTTRVLAGQSASTAQGSYGAESSGPAQWYTSSSGQNIPSSLQVSGLQSQLSYQPSSTMLASTGPSASTSQGSYGAESSGPAQWYTSSSGQNIPSSLQVSGLQSQLSYQPSSTTLASTGPSASTSQGQSLDASALFPGVASGRYTLPSGFYPSQ